MIKPRKLENMVEFCLENYPDTRNSDITLLIKVWQEFFSVRNQIQLSQMYDLPREDGISRVRRIIQNERKEYLPTEWRVAKQRGFQKDEWLQYLGWDRETIRTTKITEAELNKGFQQKLI